MVVVGRSLLINRNYTLNYVLKMLRSVKGFARQSGLRNIRPFFLKNGDKRSIGNIGGELPSSLFW